jgi:VanZ family protein
MQRLAALAWWLAMVAGTVVALLPVQYLDSPVFNWWDKAQHAVSFAVLTLWVLLLWSARTRHILLGMLVYGGALELAQAWTGWRYGEWADWAADAAGVAFAFLLFMVLKRSAFRR